MEGLVETPPLRSHPPQPHRTEPRGRTSSGGNGSTASLNFGTAYGKTAWGGEEPGQAGGAPPHHHHPPLPANPRHAPRQPGGRRRVPGALKAQPPPPQPAGRANLQGEGGREKRRIWGPHMIPTPARTHRLAARPPAPGVGNYRPQENHSFLPFLPATCPAPPGKAGGWRGGARLSPAAGGAADTRI